MMAFFPDLLTKAPGLSSGMSFSKKSQESKTVTSGVVDLSEMLFGKDTAINLPSPKSKIPGDHVVS